MFFKKILSKKKLIYSIFLLSLIFVLNLKVVSAVDEYIETLTGKSIILESGSLTKIIFDIIQYVLTFLGVIALVMFIYGGFIWMTSAGNEEKVKKAKNTITYALIGLVIVLLSYAITTFVISQIQNFSAEPIPEESP